MKIRGKRSDEEVAIDMSPMIDMVFLLLIFFIVASAIIDDKEKVKIPEAVYAKVAEDTTGRFELTVKEDGTIVVGKSPVSIEQLKEMLVPEVEFDPEVQIVIRADKSVKYKKNEEIMTACAEVGANNMIFSSFEKTVFESK
jgi:biopolymer transport protein ExbD